MRAVSRQESMLFEGQYKTAENDRRTGGIFHRFFFALIGALSVRVPRESIHAFELDVLILLSD